MTFPPQGRAGLVLAGLGPNPPHNTTLETLAALGRCDVVYANLTSKPLQGLLTGVCKEVRDLAQPAKDNLWLSEVSALWERRLTVGYAGRGPVLVGDARATSLLRAAGEAGVDRKVFPEISSMGLVLAETVRVLGDASGGFQVFDVREALGKGFEPHPEVPVVFLAIDEVAADDKRRFGELLLKAFPGRRICRVVSPRSPRGKGRECKLAQLGQGRVPLPPGTLIFISEAAGSYSPSDYDRRGSRHWTAQDHPPYPPADLEALPELESIEGDVESEIPRVEEVLKGSPDSWKGWGRLASLELNLRHYDNALEAVNRALKLRPDETSLLRLKANVYFVQFRLKEALKDLETLSQNPEIIAQSEFRRGMILGLLGRDKEALEVSHRFTSLRNGEAWSGMLEGLLAFYRGDYSLSLSRLEAAGRAEPQVEEPERLEFLRNVARLWSRRSLRTRKKKSGKRLILCGVGIDPPSKVTLAMMEALKECSHVYVNISSDRLIEFISMFCGDIRPINYQTEEDVPACAAIVAGSMKPGVTTGYVTVGNVMIFGPLTAALLRRCSKESAEATAVAGISSIDCMMASFVLLGGGSARGFQIYHSQDLNNPAFRLHHGVPTAVYFGDGDDESELLNYTRVLARWYSPDARCLLFPPYKGFDNPESVRLDELPQRAASLPGGQILIEPRER